MTNSFYNVTNSPATTSHGSSAIIRTEFANIAAGFDKFPSLSGNGNKPVMVNSGGTALAAPSSTSEYNSFLAAMDISATVAELNFCDGVTSNIQSQIDALSAIINVGSGLTPDDGEFMVGDGVNWITESGATARASLGLVIGTNVQAYNSNLNAISGFTPSDGGFIVGNGTAFVVEEGDTLRTSLGLTKMSSSTDTGTADKVVTIFDNASMGIGFEAGNALTSGTLTAVGYRAAKSATTAVMTAFGSGCLENATGSSNSGFGNSALNANTTGGGNSAFGHNSMTANTTGQLNCSFGGLSLSSNTIGSRNSSVGYESLASNTNRSDSSAFGYRALFSLNTGDENCSFGSYSLNAATSGSNNCGFGFESLNALTTGDNNCGFGSSSLHDLTTGDRNVGVGNFSASGITTGEYNVAVGDNALVNVGPTDYNVAVGYSSAGFGFDCSNGVYLGAVTRSTTNATNEIVIGYSAVGQGDNSVIIGNASITDTHFQGLISDGHQSNITASTTQSQGEQQLTKSVNEIGTCANPNDVATMPDARGGARCVVINNGANTLQLFPASGDDLGAGVNISITLAAGAVGNYIAYDSTTWVAA